jgi:hypothetical protein
MPQQALRLHQWYGKRPDPAATGERIPMSAALHTPFAPVTTRRPLGLAIITLALGGTVLAACASPAPPKPTPPPRRPPVAVEAVPYRPLPPGGADYVMTMPAKGPDGRRLTVNSNLSNDQLMWNMRSAWNVAALNCAGPEYQPILDSYRTFLTKNAKSLTAINDRIKKTYTSRFSVKRDALVARDKRTTQVYNFFAEPAARAGFCRAALDMANRALAAPPSDPLAFAQANFNGLLLPFDQFFDEYEAYQRASAEWDAKWGAQYGPSQPGWVAVQKFKAGSGAAQPAVPTGPTTTPRR